LSPSTHLSSNFPPSIPSLTLLLFKYPPSLILHSSSHIIHSFPQYPPFTYPQVINSLSTAFPQVIHNTLSYSSTFHLPLYSHLYCYFSNHPHCNPYSFPFHSYPQVH